MTLSQIIRKMVSCKAMLAGGVAMSFAASAAWSLPMGAAFNITVDTETRLVGSFDTSLAGDLDTVLVNIPMPLGDPDFCIDCLFISNSSFGDLDLNRRAGAFTDILLDRPSIRDSSVVEFGSGTQGAPDDPYFVVDAISPFPEFNADCATDAGCIGIYDNTDGNIPVRWRFSSFTMNDDQQGFTGQFEFNVVPAPATPALIVLGIIGLRLSRRKRAK